MIASVPNLEETLRNVVVRRGHEVGGRHLLMMLRDCLLGNDILAENETAPVRATSCSVPNWIDQDAARKTALERRAANALTRRVR